MSDQKTWKDVLKITGDSEKPVVVVSATARTTRQLIKSAELAAEGDLHEAIKIAETICERHEGIIRGFFESNGKPLNGELINDCLDRINSQTDTLKNYLEDISDTGSLTLQSRDAVAGIGEQISSYLLAKCGEAIGLNSRYVNARDIIKTDSVFGNAQPDLEITKMKSVRITEMLNNGQIPVIGGFIGENERGEPTTLGFEGSDYTASILGEILEAQKITIWTDVSGIYTCDPRVIPGARPIPEISFQQATEMAYFGAKVLHPSTLKPAERKQIPVFVKNLFEPENTGTKIFGKSTNSGKAKVISYRKNGVELTLTSDSDNAGHKFLSEVFSLLDRYQMPVDVVNTTEASVIIAVENNSKISELNEQLMRLGTLEVSNNKGFITLIGLEVNESAEITDRVIRVLGDTKIDLISFSASKKHLTVVLDEAELEMSVKKMHQSLFE